jgi:hypothetical protein
MPGTPTGEKAESPSAARKTLSSDSPRLKKLIRVKSMGSPMESPLVSKKDRTDQLVLGEYSLKNSVSEPVLSNPSSEGGSLSDDESSAEGKLKDSLTILRICEFLQRKIRSYMLFFYIMT